MRFGDYPAEYDFKLHGTYDPARYYGKPDTPFGEVKLGELGQWYGRRNKSLRSFAALISRGHWRWQHKYIHPKKSGISSFFHLAFGFMFLGYVINWNRIKHHANYKFH